MFERFDDPEPPTFDDRFRRAVLGRARRRQRRRLAAGGAGLTVATLVAGTAGLYGRAALRAGDVARIEVAGTGRVPAGRPVTVLVLGVDGPRPEVGGVRSDLIVLARIDPGRGTAALLSLPRDLLVTPPGGGAPVRINTLGDRPDAMVAVIESQVGVGVDHVVTLDFAGFRSLVDQVGGVEVDVRAPVRDRLTGFHVDTPGCTELDGAEALALARSRHLEILGPGGPRPDPRADLGRVDNQRALVMAALADLGVRRDPVALNRLVDWAVAHVTVDAALNRRELTRLARAALALDPDDVSGATLPVRLAPGRPDRLVQDGVRAPAAIGAFRAGRPLPAGPAVSGPAVPPLVSTC